MTGRLPDLFDPDDITEDDVLTDWEKDFLASVGSQDHEPTERQQDKWDEIEAEIPMRMAMARQGRWPIDRRR
jgi:hypothetical protein